MFQFPGFALNPYGFRVQYLHLTPCSASAGSYPALTIQRVEGGFPHSEILGSKLVRSSPRLIAAYHVLHRLSAPRHPPDALKTLDRSHDPCPPQEPRFPENPQADDQKDRSWIAPGTCLPNTTGLNSRPFKRPKLVSGPKPQPVMFPLHDVKHPQGPKGPPTNPQIFPDAPAAGKASQLVEPDGIEPTTSSLQSSRSPN